MVGSMTANVASYLLAWLASRWLGPVGYGEFASLLAAQLVLAVPALALQTVVAREAVRGKSTDALRSLGYRCTAIVAVLAVALAPAMAWLLAVFFIPFVGVFLFLMIGNPRLPRARRRKQERLGALVLS